MSVMGLKTDSMNGKNFMNQLKIRNHLFFAGGCIATTIGITSCIRHESIWRDSKRRLFEFHSKLPPFSTSPLILQRPSYVPEFIYNIKEMVRLELAKARPAQKLAWSLIGINLVVFGAWKVPSLHSFMTKHFVHVPTSNRPYTMLTSTFSHSSGIHLLFNMMALNSFLPFVQESKGLSVEQTLAFYITAGVSASLFSHVLKALNMRKAYIGGLGASGAIYAFLTASAYFHPNSKVGIVLIPDVHFKMKEAVPVLVGLDVLGLIFRWQRFDHAAHLGGAAIGLWYAMYGMRMWSDAQLWLYKWRKQK